MSLHIIVCVAKYAKRSDRPQIAIDGFEFRVFCVFGDARSPRFALRIFVIFVYIFSSCVCRNPFLCLIFPSFTIMTENFALSVPVLFYFTIVNAFGNFRSASFGSSTSFPTEIFFFVGNERLPFLFLFETNT